MYVPLQQLGQRAYWNNNSYGSAIQIKRSHLITAAAILCVCTPGTNWLLPMLGKIIKTSLVIRW
jgi:hypothetical protein